MGQLSVLLLTAVVLAPAIFSILYASIPSNHVAGWRKVAWIASGAGASGLYMLLIFPAANW